MSAIRRVLLHQQAVAHLETMPGPGPTVTVFPGEVPTDPPLLQIPGGFGPDPSGRIAPYLVVFGGAGNPVVEPDVADTVDELDWGLQLLCAAATIDDCLDLADRVHTHLFRWSPVLEGVAVGRLFPPAGYDPGSPRRLDAVQPVRFELPLQYRLAVTAS